MTPRGALASARPWALLGCLFALAITGQLVVGGAWVASAAPSVAPVSASWDFDSGLQGWSGTSTAATTTTTHSGSAGAVACTAGGQYCRTGAGTLGSGTTGTSYSMTVSGWFYSATAMKVEINLSGGGSLVYGSDCSVPAGAWTKCAQTSTVSESTGAGAYVRMDSSLSTGTFYFDDVALSSSSTGPAQVNGSVAATPTPTLTATASPSPTPTASVTPSAGTQTVTCANPCSVVLDGSQFGLLFPLLFGGLTVVIVLLAIIAVRALT